MPFLVNKSSLTAFLEQTSCQNCRFLSIFASSKQTTSNMKQPSTNQSKKTFMKLKWDSSAMPRLNRKLGVTKNEISLQVFKTKNSERAGKVLEGQSTDMEDMINLCNYYEIDICQFLLLEDNTHPIFVHNENSANENNSERTNENEDVDSLKFRLFSEQINLSHKKIFESLNSEIIRLTAENAELRCRLEKQ